MFDPLDEQPPTQWAYDQTCHALQKWRDEADRMRRLVEQAFYEGYRCGEGGEMEVDECWLDSQTLRERDRRKWA